jgi:hypothetical protein
MIDSQTNNKMIDISLSFDSSFASLRCSSLISEKTLSEITRVFREIYPEESKTYKMVLSLYLHQKKSSQGTAHNYDSIEEWLAVTLLHNLRLILRQQILPKPCSLLCPCCSDLILKMKNKKAEEVHKLLSQLCRDPNSGSKLLREIGKKAFKNAWKSYFGELKESKATLKRFSAAEVIAVQPEKAVLVIQSSIKGGEASVTPASSLDVDDLDAVIVMYD